MDEPDISTTIYVTAAALKRLEEHWQAMERHIEREVSFGSSWVTVHSLDDKVIAKAVDFIGSQHVVEIAK